MQNNQIVASKAEPTNLVVWVEIVNKELFRTDRAGIIVNEIELQEDLVCFAFARKKGARCLTI